VPLVLEQELSVTLQRTARRDMAVTVRYEGPVAAPILRGDRIGTITVTAPGLDPIERPLVAGEDVGRLGPIGRVVAAVTGLVGRVLP
jgi:serine-type D-Ala-D-Ala carboxypeptidase (penicillin-binding protein 5/6)